MQKPEQDLREESHNNKDFYNQTDHDDKFKHI